MLQSIFNRTTVPLLEKVAAFAERRQEVLAGNVANINTPTYKRRDLPVADFQEAMRNAVAQRTRPGGTNSANAPHENASPTSSSDELFPRDLFAAEVGEPKNITFQDGGNRSIEFEMMEMTKNAMLHSYAVELITAQTSLLESIIAERP
jgi:flagellar basal-body rod protein FlgB